MPERIHTFRDPLICFFRSRKRTYYILQWENGVRKWVRTDINLPNLTLHRSSVSRDATVDISIATHLTGRAKLIPITADGFYLKSGDINIPILKTTAQMSQAFMLAEYTALDTPYTNTEQRLWSIQVQIQNPPPPPPQQEMIAFIEKIPKRIAWLIADEASKNNESCPISTNPISPITASVTTCFHVFESDSINEWIKLHPDNAQCPVCRKPFDVTPAYNEVPPLGTS